MEIVDLGEIVRSQRRTVRRLGEFDELFFVVNVRKRRSHAIVGQQPKQCRLSKSALRVLEKTEFVDLLDSIEQPAARAMTAMIGWRKNRVSGVFAFEHSGRMCHA